MPGFVAEIGKEINGKFPPSEEKLIDNSFSDINYFLGRRTINKFLKDKCFFQNDRFLIIIEGIILNKENLLLKFKKNWCNTIIELYNTKGETFFNDLKGSFSGVFYDKEIDNWLIFTDQIGSKHVYYSVLAEKIIVASDIKDVYGYFKNNGIKLSLNITSAYLLLSYGFMLEDYTLAEGVKKLMPGHYIKISNNTIKVIQYYQLSNEPDYKLSEDDYIELMDNKFREAVKQQFEKDLEYGYKHLVGLSGGLDSRMTSWVAHDLGYTEQLNFTFSQSDYLDETIAKSIARDLNHEWIFKALDGGNFLKDVDEITEITGGNVLYYGLAHQNSLYKFLNFERLGLIHTGQLGDVVFGTYNESGKVMRNYSFSSGAYSLKLSFKEDLNFRYEYPNQELFKLNQRGFIGMNSGLLVGQLYTETMSPFYNIDVLEKILTIPVEYRFNHRVYKKWILKKYPKAARYKWERINNKINERSLKFKNREIILKNIPQIVQNKLADYIPVSKANGTTTKKNMNPLDYWYNTNKSLKDFYSRYFNENIHLVPTVLLKDVESLFNKGNMVEKNMVLTLLSAIKKYFM